MTPDTRSLHHARKYQVRSMIGPSMRACVREGWRRQRDRHVDMWYGAMFALHQQNPTGGLFIVRLSLSLVRLEAIQVSIDA